MPARGTNQNQEARGPRRIARAGVWLLCLLCFGPAQAAEWHVDPEAKNRVRFTSEVIMLTFHGTTDKIDGFLYWEGTSALPESARVHFEVDLNSLETGIGKRDRDMRDVLETRKWPFTTFDGLLVSVQPSDSLPNTTHVVARGNLFIHGVQREIEVPGTITRTAGSMHVEAAFTVRLEDYDIEAPSLAAFVKVSQEIALDLDFSLKEFAP